MNMSYCRFENTLADLQDCVDHWSDDQVYDPDSGDDPVRLSEDEAQARSHLLALCCLIAEEFGGMVEGEDS